MPRQRWSGAYPQAGVVRSGEWRLRSISHRGMLGRTSYVRCPWSERENSEAVGMTQLDERDMTEATERAQRRHHVVSLVPRRPYPVYGCLRDTAAGVPAVPSACVETYLITRYDDAKAALTESAHQQGHVRGHGRVHTIFGDSSVALDDNMLFSDPPQAHPAAAHREQRVQPAPYRGPCVADSAGHRRTAVALFRIRADRSAVVLRIFRCRSSSSANSSVFPRRSATTRRSGVRGARTGFSKADKEKLAVPRGFAGLFRRTHRA